MCVEISGCISLRRRPAHRAFSAAAYTVDDDPVQLWTPGDPVPPEFIEAARNPTWTVVAHNDQFEAAIEQFLLAPRFGWPLIPLERHRCTMAIVVGARIAGTT